LSGPASVCQQKAIPFRPDSAPKNFLGIENFARSQQAFLNRIAHVNAHTKGLVDSGKMATHLPQ
jgi:hypothetical protein